jgi:hypothetical protein
LEAKTPLKNQFFTPKFFSVGFRPIFPKNGGRMAANFPRQRIFFSAAGFELFCRIFGRLATVDATLFLYEVLAVYITHRTTQGVDCTL